MSAPESVVRALAAHEPRCSNSGGGGHTATNEPPIYCHPCSEAAHEWVTWTPEHVADAAWAASLLDVAERMDEKREGLTGWSTVVTAGALKGVARLLRRWADESEEP